MIVNFSPEEILLVKRSLSHSKSDLEDAMKFYGNTPELREQYIDMLHEYDVLEEKLESK